jgi:hypothetical protein
MRTPLQTSNVSNWRCSNDDGAIGLAKDMPSGNSVSIALELQSRRKARQTINPEQFGKGALCNFGCRPAAGSDREATTETSPTSKDRLK